MSAPGHADRLSAWKASVAPAFQTTTLANQVSTSVDQLSASFDQWPASVDQFHRHGGGFTAADAQTGDPSFSALGAQGVDQGGDDP